MIFLIGTIQQEFRQHFQGANVPDGEYIVQTYDGPVNVRILEGKIWVCPKEFRVEEATEINPGREIVKG